MKPNVFQPKGARITQEAPIPISKIALLDPMLGTPVSQLNLKRIYDPELSKFRLQRTAVETQNVIPIPETPNPFQGKPGKLIFYNNF